MLARGPEAGKARQSCRQDVDLISDTGEPQVTLVTKDFMGKEQNGSKLKYKNKHSFSVCIISRIR